MLCRFLCVAALCAALVPSASGQPTFKVTMDASESLFSLLAGLNACGWDHELSASDAVRAEIRQEVAQAVQASPAATRARDQLCQFILEHRQAEPALELAQYVSLALYLGPPPQFELTAQSADLPPDAAYVLGVIPFLQRFYAEAGLAQIWRRHRAVYDAQLQLLREPVTALLAEADVYLRLPIGADPERQFAIFLDMMGAPGQVNARQFGHAYFVVLTPAGGQARLETVRHSYLHYVLDPLLARRATALRRLAPMLQMVQDAPMDAGFKRDISLLVTESLIRAIEARLTPAGPGAEAARAAEVETAMAEGFILTRYFAEQLAAFEKEPIGFSTALPDILHRLDVGRERRRARDVRFASRAAPEVLRASNRRETQVLNLAEERLAGGDPEGARRLAQQALEERTADAGRAFFILARVATLNGDMQGAREHFENTLEAAREPRLVAWAHIYLGRIFDLQMERERALAHYRAALSAGDSLPETRAAAERGLQQPYEPPVTRP